MKRKTKRLLAIVAMVLLLSLCIGMQVFAADDEPIRGDYNEDGKVDIADAIYLLRHTMMPSRYPISQVGDINASHSVDISDAIYLLRNTMMPTRYPMLDAHELTHVEAKDATCTEVGNIEYWYCEACDKCLSNEKGTSIIPASDTEISALGHDYVKSVSASTAYTLVDEDTILFGEYPQALIEDSALIASLNSAAETLPTSSNSRSWTSYGYYISGSVSNYMWYIDIEEGGERYRGVYFTSYRPYLTYDSSSANNSCQDGNGYTTGMVYWFLWDPISWSILSESDGTALILCDMIIDSQAYQNEYTYDSASEKHYITGTDTYANDYEYSTIRAWLNETFYETAFNEPQKEIILTTTVDNNTENKIFLLSEEEATSYLTTNEERSRITSGYAQSQGAWISTESDYAGNGYWWLRTPYWKYDHSARCVLYFGYVSYDSVSYAAYGVVPALRISLYSVTEPTCTEQGYTTYTCTRCGDSYSSDFTNPLGHSYEITSITEAACAEDGSILFTCSVCGATKTQIINAMGHSFGEDNICDRCGYEVEAHEHSFSEEVIEPTCSSVGYTVYSCSCGYSYRANYIEQRMHSWNDGTVTIEKNCVSDGLITYECENCDAYFTEIIKASHSFSDTVITDAGCTVDGERRRECLDCGYTETEVIPAAHSWQEQATIKEATCTEAGERTYVCEACGESESFEIAPLGHNYYAGYCQRCGIHFSEDVTEYDDHLLYGMYFKVDEIVSGYGPIPIDEYGVYLYYNEGAVIEKVAVYLTQDGTMWRRCIACVGTGITYAAYVPYLSNDGEVLYTGLNSNYINVFYLSENSDGIWCYSNYATIGANLEDKDGNLLLSLYDIGEAGACTTLFASLEEMIAWLRGVCYEHSYSEIVTLPTCTEQGYTTYICAECGDSYIADYVDATGHKLGDWIIDKAPSCTESGSKHTECIKCGMVYENVYMSALGHNYTEAIVKAATCTENGEIIYSCSRCSNVYIVYTYAEHIYSVSERVEAECEKDGKIIYTCASCGDSYEEVIPGSHEYESEITKPATAYEDGIITYTCKICGDSYTEAIPARREASLLLIQDNLPWTKNDNVLLLNYLKDGGYISGWDMIGTKDIEATNLDSYSVIMIANDQSDSTYANLNLYSEKISEYAARGGVIIYGVCDEGWESGSFTYELPGGVSSDNFYSRYNYITDYSHEVVTGALTDGKGLTDSLLYGNYCSHTYFNISTLPEEANVIIRDANGNPTLVEYSFGEGHVIASGLTWEFYYQRDPYNGSLDTTYSRCVFDDLVVYAASLGNLCEHIFDTEETVEPTCTEGGYTAHTCSVCGLVFRDSFTNATGHSFGEWYTVTAATCTEDGLKRRDCNNCDEGYETGVITKLGHSYSSVVTAPSCTEQGYTTYTCECGDSYKTDYTDAIGHSLNGTEMIPGDRYLKGTPGIKEFSDHQSTCTQDGAGYFTCDNCEEMFLVTTYANHYYTASVTLPTCTEQGYTTYTCACGDSYKANYVDALGHRYSTTVTAPSCTEQGYTTYTCECGYSYKTNYVNATGHSFGEWYTVTAATCTKDGLKRRDCNNCDEGYETGVIAKLGHSYSSVVTAPTCTEQGYTTYTCECGDSYKADYVDALGHNYVSGVCTRVDEDTILFGEYPQSLVEDSALIASLNSAAGTLPTEDNAQEWTSYEYYIEGNPSNFMWYIDIEEGGERYRGVYFTSYRRTTVDAPDENSLQDENGYYTGTSYWFLYEPISWSILSESEDTALILCDMILDSQAYQNEFEYDSEEDKYYIKGTDTYANNYEYSTIRAWLNETFYETSFNELQKELILTTLVDNDEESTGYAPNEYICSDTEDKIFMLSYEEVVLYLEAVEERYRKPSDYALGQGAWNSPRPEYLGNGDWWLRSPSSTISQGTRSVDYAGVIDYDWFHILQTDRGVVPALRIRLHNYESNVVTEPTCTEQGYTTYTCAECGYSYKANYVDATGHNYIDDICENCGKEFIPGEGLEYTLSAYGTYYIVSGIGTCADTDIIIPDTYNNLPVKGIGSYAFYDCDALTSVSFGDNSQLQTIGSFAFSDCNALTSIEIPASVTSIDVWAFSNCSALTSVSFGDNSQLQTICGDAFYKCSALTSIEIPASVTRIGSDAFYKCSALTSIEIPASVTRIGSDAFSDCSALTSVSFGDNSQLQTIGNYAFAWCDALTSIEIPASVTSIDSYAFEYCYKLVEVINKSSLNITKGSEDYGYVAYYALEVHSEESKIVNIDDYLFYTYKGVNYLLGYVGEDTELILPENYNGKNYKIYEYAFYNRDDITSVEIPESVTSIGSLAFSGCSALVSIEIPASVTSIGSSAFSYCDALTSIEIPASVTSIVGSSAFYGCYKLVEVINKSSLNITKGSSANGYVAYYALEVHSGESKIVNIDDYLFYTYEGVNYLVNYVGSDTELILPEDYNGENYEINKYAFYNRYDIISVEISTSVTSIGSSAFSGCSSLTFNEYDNAYYLGNEENPYYALIKAKDTSITSCVINENTKVIADYAFYGCSALKSVSFGDNSQLQTIGYYAFSSCDALSSVSFGTNSQLQTIGNYAFAWCDALTSIEIPASVTSIGSHAFYGCSALKSVSFGDNSQLQTIGERAFDDCDALTSIEIPASVTSIGSDAFSGCYKLVEVINKSSLNITKGSSDYGYVARYALEVHSEESKIVNKDDYLFYIYEGVNYLLGYVGEDSELILPEDYNGENYEINKYAFYNRDDIISVEIPASVTSIGYRAFYDCDALTSIEIPASVTSIGYSAFEYCSALKSVSFGDNSQLQTIGYYAFRYCSALTSIEIPASVTRIGSDAFSDCSSLTFNEYDNAYYLGNEENPYYALIDTKNTSMTSCVINENTKVIADGAFDSCRNLTSIEIPASVTSIGHFAFRYCSALESVTFQNTSGWWYSSSSTETSGTSISSSSLANASTAATYLKSTYSSRYWKRG